MTRFSTKLVHSGEPAARIMRAVAMPIFQSSTFVSSDDGGYHDIRYARLNNTPNHFALHAKIADIEGGEEALVTGSGMAAISAALLSVLKAGDHVLTQSCVYGGTQSLLAGDLSRFGVSYDPIDARDPGSWKEKLRPSTKVLYVESITNPTLEVADLPAVAKFAREHGLVSMIDNTFATPVNFRPIEYGFDLVLHSGTKYLNGHSDLIAGAVVGSARLVAGVRHTLNHFGGTLDPHACFLLQRGLKTLSVRVRHQNESALALARMLSAHSAVTRVNYPGLESHPDHARAKDLFGGFGGMVSFELAGGLQAAERFFDRVKIPLIAPSLGGPETLLILPARSSHAGLSPEARAASGISDSLVRMSVGLEDTEDLIEDLQGALG